MNDSRSISRHFDGEQNKKSFDSPRNHTFSSPIIIMFRGVSKFAARSYSSSVRRTAEAAAPAAAMTLNFVTPHSVVYLNKRVEKVMIPGDGGEFGITAGHAALISQLKAGVVTVVFEGVSEKPDTMDINPHSPFRVI